MNKETPSTKEVAEMFNKSVFSVLKWARVYHTNRIEHKRNPSYIWDEENINAYKNYLENLEKTSNNKQKTALPYTDNLDTLYHRLLRSKKNGNIEQYNQTRKILDELKKNKN